MTPDERQMLADLFERVRASGNAPRDAQAEAFITDATKALPYAPYVLAQTVLVQQHTLEEAARRIAELEARLQPPAAAPPETSFLGGLGRSIFGGAQQPPSAPRAPAYDASAYQRGSAPPPPPQGYAQPSYAPPPPQQPGPWGAPAAPMGGGFLQGALQTATGVAGGVLLGNAVSGLFGGHGGGGGGLFGGGLASSGLAPHETINNYYEAPQVTSDQHSRAGFLDDADDQVDSDAGYDDDSMDT